MQQACFGEHEASVRADRLLVSRTRHTPFLKTPAHSHPVMCLHVVLEGVYEEATRAGRHRLEPGWVLFKPGGEAHWNEFGSRGATTLRIELDPDSFPELTRHLPGRLTAFGSRHLATLAKRADHELSAIDDLTPVVTESVALELLARVARMGISRPGRGAALARRCARLLEERFTEPYRLGQAAHELGVDRTVLAHAFREEFGRSVGEYIRQRRVEYAASRLRGGSVRSLGELAIEAGFADQSHFTRTFKSVYGCPPGAWRRQAAERSGTRAADRSARRSADAYVNPPTR